MTGDYVFGHTGLLDEQRSLMQQSLDPATFAQLDALGVSRGWRCLDVGGGGGSVARWLADRVGPTGYVLATDIDPGAMESQGVLDVVRHDIVRDDLPEASFDLVHARLVLLHLPERRRALEQMIRALRPGGRLLLGEFDCTRMPTLAVPATGDAEVFERFHAALCRLLERAGADLRWGVHAYAAMTGAGLVDLDSTASAQAWPGGGIGCRWLHINSRQLETPMLDTGLMTLEELTRLRELLMDPNFVVSSYLTVSTTGRRPAHPTTRQHR